MAGPVETRTGSRHSYQVVISFVKLTLQHMRVMFLAGRLAERSAD